MNRTTARCYLTMPVTSAVSARADLICSAKEPGQAVRGIEAKIICGTNRSLTFRYILRGKTTRLNIPVPSASRRAEGLWQHTCFEAFVGVKDSPRYYEFNFAPSGEWAVYAFHAYRHGGPLDGKEIAPRISVRLSSGRLELASTIDLDDLPWVRSSTHLQIGLSAVIEEGSGECSYWAVNHPTAKPDFHHPDSFALELAVPRASA